MNRIAFVSRLKRSTQCVHTTYGDNLHYNEHLIPSRIYLFLSCSYLAHDVVFNNLLSNNRGSTAQATTSYLSQIFLGIEHGNTVGRDSTHMTPLVLPVAIFFRSRLISCKRWRRNRFWQAWSLPPMSNHSSFIKLQISSRASWLCDGWQYRLVMVGRILANLCAAKVLHSRSKTQRLFA